MRILQVHTRYREPGGEDAVVDTEAALLRAAGHDVVQHIERNPQTAIGAIGALVTAPWNPAAARRVASAAQQSRADVVHVHNTWFTLSPAVVGALARTGAPVVLTLHNYRLLCANAQLYRDGGPCELCVGSHPWHGVVHACYRDSRVQSVPAALTVAAGRTQWPKSVEVFCALTAFAKERFVAGGLPEERIAVKSNAVTDPGVRAAPPSSSREVLFVGRLAPEKGLDVPIRAFSDDGVAGLELVVIGDGPERSRLEDLAGPRVTFAGRLTPDEVRGRMLAARALVFPSRWYETFGLVAAEAMAAGLPVVASHLGGIPDVVGPGGWFARPGDVDDWARALRSLNDPARVDAVGAAARAEWARRFSPERVLPTLLEIYETAQRRAASAAGSRSEP